MSERRHDDGEDNLRLCAHNFPERRERGRGALVVQRLEQGRNGGVDRMATQVSLHRVERMSCCCTYIRRLIAQRMSHNTNKCVFMVFKLRLGRIRQNVRNGTTHTGASRRGGCMHRTLAEDRGIRCVVLDYDAMRGFDDPESRLF